MRNYIKHAFECIAEDLIESVEHSETARLIIAAWWRWATDQPGDVKAWIEVLEDQCEFAKRMGLEPASIVQQAKRTGIKHQDRLYDAAGLTANDVWPEKFNA